MNLGTIIAQIVDIDLIGKAKNVTGEGDKLFDLKGGLMGRIGGINTDPDWGGANINADKRCRSCGKREELNFNNLCYSCAKKFATIDPGKNSMPEEINWKTY